MSIIQISTPFNIDLEFEIAEFHKRLLAYIIDFVLMVIYVLSLKYFLYDGLGFEQDEAMGLDILVVSLPMMLYPLFSELWMNGQSIGKKILSIRVISLEGGEPTLGQYLSRWITRMWEWPFLFGYVALPNKLDITAYIMATAISGVVVVIIVAVNSQSQRLGDMLAGTVVVNTQTNLGLKDTIFMQVSQTDYKVLFPEVMRLSDRDINTIKSVVTQANKKGNYDMCNRVAQKVQHVLNISTGMYAHDFLEKLLEDYNYLATRE